jgi:hypothetical protein
MDADVKEYAIDLLRAGLRTLAIFNRTCQAVAHAAHAIEDHYKPRTEVPPSSEWGDVTHVPPVDPKVRDTFTTRLRLLVAKDWVRIAHGQDWGTTWSAQDLEFFETTILSALQDYDNKRTNPPRCEKCGASFLFGPHKPTCNFAATT